MLETALLLPLAIGLTLWLDLEGAALAMTLSAVGAGVPALGAALRVLGARPGELARALVPAALPAALLAVTLWLVEPSVLLRLARARGDRRLLGRSAPVRARRAASGLAGAAARMRLAVVARRVQRGESLASQALGAVRGLAERGHEVELFTIGATLEHDLVPGVTVRDVPVGVSNGRIGLAREIASFAREAARLLEPARYDLVYSRLPGACPGDVLNVPGLVDREVEAWIAGRGEAGLARQLKDRVQPIVRPVTGVRRRGERRALAYPGLLFAEVAAPAIREDVLAACPLPPDRVVWAPPGVSLDALEPVERPANPVVSLLFCGHTFRRKGLDRAIEALARMREPARLVVVGGDDPAPFLDLAREAGVADRVEFAGAVRDPAPFYRAADIVVFPSRVDVWASVVIEGMAAALPVVTSSGSGAAQAVETRPDRVRAARAARRRGAGGRPRLARRGRGHARAHGRGGPSGGGVLRLARAPRPAGGDPRRGRRAPSDALAPRGEKRPAVCEREARGRSGRAAQRGEEREPRGPANDRRESPRGAGGPPHASRLPRLR